MYVVYRLPATGLVEVVWNSLPAAGSRSSMK